MNYWNRALCSVTRRKGKSIILFAVIFILGNVIAGSIAIQQSTANVEKKIKHDLGATVSVELDYQKMMDEGQSFSPSTLKVEDVKKLGQSSYVKEFDYNVKTNFFVKKIKTYEMENATTMGGMPKMLSIKGNNLLEPLDFKDKKVNLVEGRTFKQDEINNGKDVAIISKKLAEENGFNVGDKVVLDSLIMDYKQDGSTEELASQDHPVEIIGIFEPTSVEKKKSDGKDQKGFEEQFMETEQFNTVYMPNDAVMNINKIEFEKGKSLLPDHYKKADGTDMTQEDMDQITPIYVLKSPEDVEAFKEESKSMIPEGYKVTASTDQYDEVGGTFKKMSQISGYVVILAIGATLLIISLVVILFLRDRKHELGIYLSLGETRAKVMQQILIELLLISLIAMCLSLVTGNLLGKMVSESLIASDAFSQTSNAASNGAAMTIGGGSGVNMSSLTTEDVSSAYEVKFSISYIVTFLIAGLSTVLLSAILPLTYVLRLNPKKIMM
ncbi:ABC transporter permease [Enterococcus plantarum]|uniref:ABC transporter permease n=1 Tax=Enterococcus plantarum TaxID=1077675 RepID=A0A2W4A1K8_9ENTE|nr:ABC transporter permease [Enterococcus plantarum]MBO0422915.1 ABC transporter permease [Enterococcus plantarum]MBO0466956.1 ABC transporter permease [Enterococcus plantarum]OEG18515.1 ABC transporter permease [Enterococcus plantarum]PZL74803.1 ABC transporter permease [Enterococcus plantarum]